MRRIGKLGFDPRDELARLLDTKNRRCGCDKAGFLNQQLGARLSGRDCVSGHFVFIVSKLR